MSSAPHAARLIAPVPVETPAGSAARRETLWVLLLALLVGLAFQGSRHLFDPDEGRYTDVAHEMLELGDWLVPRLDPERPHFTKPPLAYWALGASFASFGNNEWAARLPNALAFAATGLLVVGLARHLGTPSPLFTAAAWATAWGPAAAANVVTTDTLLALFETLAVYGYVASGLVTSADRPRAGPLHLMWLGFGLAFLTKGPPGLLPLMAIVAFTTWRRRQHLLRLFPPFGLLLFGLVGLGWYVVLVTRAPDLLDYFLVHETVARVASGEHHRNPGWFGWLWVYAPTLLFGCLPWLAVAAVDRWRQRGTGTVAPRLDGDVRRFLVLWFTLPFAVFALAQSRLPLYVLPLFVPVMLALTGRPGTWASDRRHAAVVIAVAAVLVIGLKFAGAQLHSSDDAHALAADLGQVFDLDTITEVAFVDVPARYGLKHYLGMNVEQLESHEGAIGPAGYAAPEPLCHELSVGESLLLIAPARHLGPVEEQLRECPHLAERVGTLRQWALYRSLPPPPVQP